jgi:hypothetical protein
VGKLESARTKSYASIRVVVGVATAVALLDPNVYIPHYYRYGKEKDAPITGFK